MSGGLILLVLVFTGHKRLLEFVKVLKSFGDFGSRDTSDLQFLVFKLLDFTSVDLQSAEDISEGPDVVRLPGPKGMSLPWSIFVLSLKLLSKSVELLLHHSGSSQSSSVIEALWSG